MSFPGKNVQGLIVKTKTVLRIIFSDEESMEIMVFYITFVCIR